MTISIDFNLGKRTNGKSTQIVDCGHASDTNYAAATGQAITAVADFLPSEPITGLLLDAGTGTLAVELEGGGVMTVDITVAAGSLEEVLMGFRIAKIFSTSTFTGHIWPLA